jgi:hypothetical protein
MANPHEAIGKDVLEKSANEFRGWQRGDLAPIAIRPISIMESHVAVLGREEAMVGDGHAVCVASQIVQHFLGAGKRALGVDHPAFLPQAAKPFVQARFASELLQLGR